MDPTGAIPTTAAMQLGSTVKTLIPTHYHYKLYGEIKEDPPHDTGTYQYLPIGDQESEIAIEFTYVKMRTSKVTTNPAYFIGRSIQIAGTNLAMASIEKKHGKKHPEVLLRRAHQKESKFVKVRFRIPIKIALNLTHFERWDLDDYKNHTAMNEATAQKAVAERFEGIRQNKVVAPVPLARYTGRKHDPYTRITHASVLPGTGKAENANTENLEVTVYVDCAGPHIEGDRRGRIVTVVITVFTPGVPFFLINESTDQFTIKFEVRTGTAQSGKPNVKRIPSGNPGMDSSVDEYFEIPGHPKLGSPAAVPLEEIVQHPSSFRQDANDETQAMDIVHMILNGNEDAAETALTILHEAKDPGNSPFKFARDLLDQVFLRDMPTQFDAWSELFHFVRANAESFRLGEILDHIINHEDTKAEQILKKLFPVKTERFTFLEWALPIKGYHAPSGMKNLKDIFNAVRGQYVFEHPEAVVNQPPPTLPADPPVEARPRRPRPKGPITVRGYQPRNEQDETIRENKKAERPLNEHDVSLMTDAEVLNEAYNHYLSDDMEKVRTLIRLYAPNAGMTPSEILAMIIERSFRLIPPTYIPGPGRDENLNLRALLRSLNPK
ncbi:hypothetical protein ACFYPT_39065 [Streptomyces sp. NPDC005529]|uniref:hypothetical protein n=1 Tax=unclassified Streptomyces TaxID=2593676 RepID=UPI0033BDB56F